MSTKAEVQEQLMSIGFSVDYVERAFKVYEEVYGHSYDLEVLAEIIALGTDFRRQEALVKELKMETKMKKLSQELEIARKEQRRLKGQNEELQNKVNALEDKMGSINTLNLDELNALKTKKQNEIKIIEEVWVHKQAK